MSCSYAELALATFDNRALAYNCSPTIWERFRDDVFVDYDSNLDDTGKIKFTM